MGLILVDLATDGSDFRVINTRGQELAGQRQRHLKVTLPGD